MESVSYGTISHRHTHIEYLCQLRQRRQSCRLLVTQAGYGRTGIFGHHAFGSHRSFLTCKSNLSEGSVNCALTYTRLPHARHACMSHVWRELEQTLGSYQSMILWLWPWWFDALGLISSGSALSWKHSSMVLRLISKYWLASLWNIPLSSVALVTFQCRS